MKNKFFSYLLSFLLVAYCTQCITSAIIWEPNGGRFGDNLLSYAKAKWLSYKFNIPVLCLPFKYADQLMLAQQETFYTVELAQQFSRIMRLPNAINYTLHPHSNTLYISHWNAHIPIDWFDTIFLEEIKKNISPLYPIKKIVIPDNCISIAVHVRNGGGFAADTQQEKKRCPLRFVPDEFFIEQIQRIADMFPTEKIYVYIFTDHPEPIQLKQKFGNSLKNPRLILDCREKNNSHHSNVLEDFFSMMDFDCLIRPGSHYSRFVQRLGNNKMVIYPESIKKISPDKYVINVINIKVRENSGQRWKTKKVTIA